MSGAKAIRALCSVGVICTAAVPCWAQEPETQPTVQPISQVVYVLALSIYAKDGTGPVRTRFSNLAAGLTPPEFPKVGEAAVIDFDSDRFHVVIRRNSRNYTLSGNAISTLVSVEAVLQ